MEGAVVTDDSRWDDFMGWAGMVAAAIDLEQEEHAYKRALSSRLQEARAGFLADRGGWVDELVGAIQGTNLLHWRTLRRIKEGASERPDAFARAVGTLWSENHVDADSLASFEDPIREAVDAATPGNVVALGSLLLMARDAGAFPPYRATPVESWRRLVGRQAPGGQPAERYRELLELTDELLARAADNGISLADRLEAQGLAWSVVKWPVADLPIPETEQRALARWRGEKMMPGAEAHSETDATAGTDEERAPEPAVMVPELRAVTDDVARDVHMARDELQEIVDVLQTRQQVVFYGPPGTGKTYVAQKLARHLVGDDAGRARLVQFHPSYAYEDFFEGYRPDVTSGGAATFSLQPGPLRQLASEAAKPENSSLPFVLIIDEMNRANLAKVFGELYFLLEYRNEAIRLQYTPTEAFRLPKNLFIIGTMNTADRSIAMVDAAIRRRFAFVEMHPNEAPVRGVLDRYVTARGLDRERVLLLDALNAAIGQDDRDLQIGPSYLMRSDAESERGLARVWKFDLLPLLEEHYYGRMDRGAVHERFGLDALRRQTVRGQEEAEPQPSPTGGEVSTAGLGRP